MKFEAKIEMPEQLYELLKKGCSCANCCTKEHYTKCGIALDHMDEAKENGFVFDPKYNICLFYKDKEV